MWLPTRWTSRHCDGLGLMFQQHYFSINSWCDKVNNITFQKTTLQFSGNGNTTRRSSNTGWTLKKGASWAKTPLRLRPMSNRSRVESLSSLESLTPSQEALTAMASHLLSPRRMVLSTCACCNCKSDWFFFSFDLRKDNKVTLLNKAMETLLTKTAKLEDILSKLSSVEEDRFTVLGSQSE